MIATATYVVANRYVVTYQPERWPEGLLTGWDNGEGGFALEHVVAFQPRALLPLLRAGIEEAWAHDFTYITFFLPHAFPLTPKLAVLARRCGFAEFYRDEGATHYVRYRP